MAQKQLVELNHRHMAIAEFILSNPSARLTEIAAAVGMSANWVSIVTNSELFKEYLQQRNREISDIVHLSLQEKVAGIAHRAVEKLGDAIDNSNDPAFILAAADKTLGRLGYGVKNGTQVNVGGPGGSAPGPSAGTQVNIAVIAEAREKMYLLAGKVDPHGPHVPAAEKLPPREGHSLGETSPPALVYQEKETSGPEGGRGAVREEGDGTLSGEYLPAASAGSVD